MAEQQPITPAFKPTSLQLRYRDARATALADGRVFTDAVLARQLGCRQATISNWKQDAEFLEWLDSDAREALQQYCAPVLLRTAQRALDGSIAHAKLLFRVLDSSPLRRQRVGELEVVVAIPRAQARNDAGEISTAAREEQSGFRFSRRQFSKCI
jgi:hypothetical protein